MEHNYNRDTQGFFSSKQEDQDLTPFPRNNIFDKDPKQQESFNLTHEMFEWCEAIVFSLVVVVLLFTFVFRIVGVDGESMLPTLQDKDRVVISNIFYEPKPGDIVVITQPTMVNHPLIKRIIAMEGQKVDIDYEKGAVYVDGIMLDESYILEPTTRVPNDSIELPATVPPGHVFVMGDNRNNSSDSRVSGIGMIDTRYLLGRAVFRVFPLSTIGKLN